MIKNILGKKKKKQRNRLSLNGGYITSNCKTYLATRNIVEDVEAVVEHYYLARQVIAPGHPHRQVLLAVAAELPRGHRIAKVAHVVLLGPLPRRQRLSLVQQILVKHLTCNRRKTCR